LAEIKEELEHIWRSGQVTTAEYTSRFEQQVASRLGVRYAVALANCTSGLILALKALKVKGEVIVPSFTFAASVHAIVWAGCTPVFCDCEPNTYTLDVSQAEGLIRENTGALMPVYTYGLPPDIDALEKLAERHRLPLIYDAAQALGARYKDSLTGGFGRCELFSLSPSKAVSAIEGGLLTTNEAGLATKIKKMRDYGKGEDGYDMEYVGLSARMSELHALVGLKNLENLDRLRERRDQLISLYKQELTGLPEIAFQHIPAERQPSGNYLVIFVSERGQFSRDYLCETLRDKGVETKMYFYPPVHLQSAYSAYKARYQARLPVTESAARSCLALPLYADLGQDEVRYICRLIKEATHQAG
jgi:dTDP-4-amino-4,6-dideoxygalactose transaminase